MQWRAEVLGCQGEHSFVSSNEDLYPKTNHKDAVNQILLFTCSLFQIYDCSIRFISGVTLVACSIVSFSCLTLLFLFLHFQSVPEAPLNRFDKRERRDIKGFKFSICRNIKTS